VVVLAIIAPSAFVLDAFEIVFVVVPIVLPPLLVRVVDARWVAVLVLLTLQMSFLLQPFGYALMMVRGTFKESVRPAVLVRALAPFLLAQWSVLAIVIVAPRRVHLGERPDDRIRAVPVSPHKISSISFAVPAPTALSDPNLQP
jgi:TRAP-type mannitol/chloroaromatic compound transport system permease large subunit